MDVPPNIELNSLTIIGESNPVYLDAQSLKEFIKSYLVYFKDNPNHFMHKITKIDVQEKLSPHWDMLI